MAGKRRGHGEGSIYKTADGRWRGMLDLGWQSGKRQRKYFSGETRLEVHQRLDEARRQHEQGALALGPNQTVQPFLLGWLLYTAQHRLRPRTYTRYQELLRLHALPTLGKLQLVK